jgi:acyl-CoA oxidase
LGTEKHKNYLDECRKFKDLGCFALTELGVGSNVKGVETIAKFDKKTKEIVINTPN